uniref:Uncharacterized protein n=1 Tax=Rhizophagus irregularis (strain DAOM 181602 / DAOM 197198 / MUCL 43194) TaxID=747089 RepID=U9TEG3_RHIID
MINTSVDNFFVLSSFFTAKKLASRKLLYFRRYNYSAEDGFEIKVDENETILDLSSDTLSDKLAFLEANPSTNIKRTLDGEELTATETAIFEYFDNTELQNFLLRAETCTRNFQIM